MREDEPTVPNQRWPGAPMPYQPTHTPRGRQGSVMGMLAVSIGANVALIAGLLSVVLLAHGGYFTASVQPTTRISATSTVVSSPTPAPSATPTAGWLRVWPPSVQLGCDDGQQQQFIVLQNTGTDDVQFQVVYSVSADQSGVTVSPRQGNVRAGTSIVLQIQSRRQSDDQQGMIHFDPDTSDAGTPPGLHYMATGC